MESVHQLQKEDSFLGKLKIQIYLSNQNNDQSVINVVTDRLRELHSYNELNCIFRQSFLNAHIDPELSRKMIQSIMIIILF